MSRILASLLTYERVITGPSKGLKLSDADFLSFKTLPNNIIWYQDLKRSLSLYDNVLCTCHCAVRKRREIIIIDIYARRAVVIQIRTLYSSRLVVAEMKMSYLI